MDVWGLRALGYDDRRGSRSVRLPPGLALTVVGPFELSYDGGTITLPPMLERVVAYLALHRGPAKRPNVAGTLWGDTSETRAMASLRSALWRLRRAGLPMIDGSGEHLALSPLVFQIMRPFLTPFILASILAIVVNPANNWLRSRIRRPSLAAFVTTLAVGVLLAVVVVALGFALTHELTDAYDAPSLPPAASAG